MNKWCIDEKEMQKREKIVGLLLEKEIAKKEELQMEKVRKIEQFFFIYERKRRIENIWFIKV